VVVVLEKVVRLEFVVVLLYLHLMTHLLLLMDFQLTNVVVHKEVEMHLIPSTLQI
jgi:hypothetical protein